jgi:adenine-specific DNA-methyltransferase
MENMADNRKALGQFFTPRALADLMVHLVEHPADARILEPAAGTGVFVDSLRQAGFMDVTALEIDPRLANGRAGVIVGDFFAPAEPGRRWDVIIGNPPYVRWRNVPEATRRRFLGDPFWKNRLNGLADLLYPFIMHAVDRLEPGGELVFVTPSFWLTAAHAEAVRKALLDSGAVRSVILFDEKQVFDGVSTNAAIFRFVKGAEKWPVRVYRLTGKGRLDSADLADLGTALRGGRVGGVEQFQAPHPRDAAPWHLMTARQAEAVEVVETACRLDGRTSTLGDVADIANGMVSGLDLAFRLDEGDGVPLDETDGTVSAMRASGLRQLVPTAPHRYIYLNHVASEFELARRYPTLYARLRPHRPDLEARYQYGRAIPWWHWVFPRNEKALRAAGDKIVVPCKERFDGRGHVRFAIVPAGTLIVQDTTAIIPKPGTREDVRYLAAWLTSAAMFGWLKAKGRLRGGVLEFSEAPLAAMPVRLIDWNDPDERAGHDRIVTAAALAEQGRYPVSEALKVAEQEFAKLMQPNRRLVVPAFGRDPMSEAVNTHL